MITRARSRRCWWDASGRIVVWPPDVFLLRALRSPNAARGINWEPQGGAPKSFIVTKRCQGTHAKTHAHTQIRSCTDSLTLRLTHAQTHSCTDSLTLEFTHAQAHSHSHSLTLRRTHTTTHSHSDSSMQRLTHTQTHSHPDSLVHRPTHTQTHSCTDFFGSMGA